jgi:ABC-type transporter Mla MlaB component
MVGDNNLNSYVKQDINEMERGWKDSFDGDLLVYVDQKGTSPYILKISSDRTGSIVSEEVMKYAEQNSSSLEVMEKVLADIKSMYPAKSYGLVLWSHANGWFPANSSATKSFGDDDGKSMDIAELAKLSGKYDFLIFDACDMMGIEAAYELKYNADYIVASVTEVLAGGFPYDDILEYLFMKNADLVSVCQKFMELYRSYPDTQLQTAALSVVKTGNLDDVAAVSKNLMRKYKGNIADLDLSQIQQYDSDGTALFFDFLDFMEHLAGNDPEIQTLRTRLSSAVIFEDHTPTILDILEIRKSCGLSCYIPGQYQYLDGVYRTTAWYKAVY